MMNLKQGLQNLKTKEIDRIEKLLIQRKLAVNKFSSFVPYVKEKYQMKWFHKTICDRLQDVYEGKIKKLMIFVPPQHGKTEISTRSFPAWVLGKDPSKKLAIVSYSATIAEGFGSDVIRRIDTDKYKSIFSETNLSDGKGTAKRTNGFFEILGQIGSCTCVGRGGSLTSKSVDIGIIDDPLKDRLEANSLTIREGLWGWYQDVFLTRLHNDSAQVLIQTRWHEDDLAGRLLAIENDWTIIKFPAIRENDLNDYDPRNEGEVLWEEKHSLERMLAKQLNTPVSFNALYQQDPKPNKEALVFNWAICEDFPNDCQAVFRGLDFGFTNDPTALIKIGKTGQRLYLHEEIYSVGLTNPMIYERCKAIGVDTEIFAESADPKSIEELKRLGLNIKPAIKGPGSIMAGILKLQEFDVFVTKTSKNLIREKNNYQWIMQGDKATDKPIDDFNHGIDATRYGIYTKYNTPPLREFWSV